jgi:hypothetical protein
MVRIQPFFCLAKISLGNRNILKASTAARDHARRQVEWYPEHSSALNRFEEEVKQAQKELILRIRPEIDGKAEEPG